MSNLPYQEPPGHRSITASVMYAKDDKEESQNERGRIEMSPSYQQPAKLRQRIPPCCVIQKWKDIRAALAQAPNQTQADSSPVRILIAKHNVEFCGGQAHKSLQGGLSVFGNELWRPDI